MNAPTNPMSQKAEEVAFLTEEFEIPPVKAAELVTENPEQAERLAADEMRRQRHADPLSGAPTPRQEGADTYPNPKFDSIPVAHVDNDRTGAG